MRRADHSSRGVLPTVVCHCVWSRNLKNEEAKTRKWVVKASKGRRRRRISFYWTIINHILRFSIAWEIKNVSTPHPIWFFAKWDLCTSDGPLWTACAPQSSTKGEKFVDKFTEHKLPIKHCTPSVTWCISCTVFDSEHSAQISTRDKLRKTTTHDRVLPQGSNLVFPYSK
jgi:hypothetical protein